MFSAGSAVAADYKIDKEGQHAFVNFRIQHLGYSWLYGTFKDFDGTFTFDEKNPAADKVNVTINTTSVDTNHAERDKHLRSADFLNTAKYPQATFTSTSVKKDGDELDITGDLTLNGVTKPVTLEAKLIGQGDDPWGGKRAGFEAEGKIKLKDFNIKTDLGPASGSGSDYFSGRRTAEVRVNVAGWHASGNDIYSVGSGMPSVVFRRPRDLLKILLPFSRPARRRRCSSGGNALSSQQISLQQPLYFSAHTGH